MTHRTKLIALFLPVMLCFTALFVPGAHAQQSALQTTTPSIDPLTTPGDAQAESEPSASERGLYVLTPPVPSAVRSITYSTGGNREDVASEGVYVDDLNAKVGTGTIIRPYLPYPGEPFGCFTVDGPAENRYGCILLTDGAAVGTSGIAVFDSTEEGYRYSVETNPNALFSEEIDPDVLNRLTLHPDITKENPLVFYLCGGVCAVTLDGSQSFVFCVYDGYCAEEVELMALQLHKSNDALEDCVIQNIFTPLDTSTLSDQSNTQYLAEEESAALNQKVKAAGYDFGELEFQLSHGRQIGRRSISLQELPGVDLYVLVEFSDNELQRVDTWAMYEGTRYEIAETPGDDLIALEEKALQTLRPQVLLHAALTEIAGSWGRWSQEDFQLLRPLEQIVPLGEYANEFTISNGVQWYLATKELYIRGRQPVTLWAAIQIPPKSSGNQTLSSFYAVSGGQVIKASPQDNLSSLLDHFRK